MNEWTGSWICPYKFDYFHSCVLQVYEGYADEPRNTDNAWIETAVLNIHLDSAGSLMNELNRKVFSFLTSHALTVEV